MKVLRNSRIFHPQYIYIYYIYDTLSVNLLEKASKSYI